MATYNIRQRLETEITRQHQTNQQSILSLQTSRFLSIYINLLDYYYYYLNLCYIFIENY